jgi:hypothetical protein
MLAFEHGQPAALALDDLGHQARAAAAAGSGATVSAHVGARAGAVFHAGSDFSVGDTVAVANDHERLGQASLLKVIVKVIL